jgi:hypothetical protein
MDFTKQQIKDFTENPIWKDLRATLELRIEEYRNELEKNLNWDETQRTRASINQLRFLMSQPELMLIEIQAEEATKE